MKNVVSPCWLRNDQGNCEAKHLDFVKGNTGVTNSSQNVALLTTSSILRGHCSLSGWWQCLNTHSNLSISSALCACFYMFLYFLYLVFDIWQLFWFWLSVSFKRDNKDNRHSIAVTEKHEKNKYQKITGDIAGWSSFFFVVVSGVFHFFVMLFFVDVFECIIFSCVWCSYHFVMLVLVHFQFSMLSAIL